MERLVEFIRERDRFAKLAGVELLDVAPGYAKARLDIREHHLNAVGLVHGAVIFALADLVFQAAGNSHGLTAMAVNVSISFLKAARGGPLSAEAREIALNPKLASYTATVSDEAGDTLAIFQGMAYRRKDRLPI